MPAEEAASASGGTGAGGEVEGGAVDVWAASPLSELLRPTQLPAISTSQACKDVLQLLQVRGRAGNGDVGARVGRQLVMSW